MTVKLTKKEIIELIMKDSGLTKSKATKSLNGLIDVVSKEIVEGRDVTLRGIGTFKKREVAAYDALDPRNGNKIRVAAHNSVTFIPSHKLRLLVNK